MNKLEITPSNINDKERLVAELRALIVHSLNLHHLQPDALQADTPFGQNGLTLDSVDILEMVVAVEQKYKVKVKDADAGRVHFRSISTIADFVIAEKALEH